MSNQPLIVHSDDGSVVATMVSGDFFGEIGILNLSGGINMYVAKIKYVLAYTLLHSVFLACHALFSSPYIVADRLTIMNAIYVATEQM